MINFPCLRAPTLGRSDVEQDDASDISEPDADTSDHLRDEHHESMMMMETTKQSNDKTKQSS